MTVELKPDTERLIQEEIGRGHFRSVDDLIVECLSAWREKHQVETSEPRPRKRLYDLLTLPPFAGSELTIERQKDGPRPIDLS